MGTIKTLVNDASVTDFIATVPEQTKRVDSFVILELFKKVTGEEPRMWGTSIIGFGMYHYKSEKSKQEGDWPLVGFSPRKQNLTLYVKLDSKDTTLFEKLGKHKTSGGCLYINRLTDVDLKVLEEIIKRGFASAKQIHGTMPNV